MGWKWGFFCPRPVLDFPADGFSVSKNDRILTNVLVLHPLNAGTLELCAHFYFWQRATGLAKELFWRALVCS